MKPRRSFLPLPMTLQARRFIRSFRENLQLGTLLAFIAGMVNTVGFLQFDTYVSHISGHATRTAVEYTEGNMPAAGVFFMETLAFIAGAFVSSFLMQGHRATDARIKFTLPMGLEAFWLLIYLLINRFHVWSWLQIDHINLITLILAHAMGIQNALLRHAGGAIVRTTHMTGVATDIGIEMGSAFYAARSCWKKARAVSAFPLRAALHAFFRTLGISRFSFHCLLLFFFFFGAGIGAIGYRYVMGAIIYIPFVLLCLLAYREYRRQLPIAAVDAGDQGIA